MSMRRCLGHGSRTLYSYLVRLDADLLELIADVVGELDLVRRAGVVRLGGHHVEVGFGRLRGRHRLQLALARALRPRSPPAENPRMRAAPAARAGSGAERRHAARNSRP